ncbi:MAG: HEAT repeat domain-containing protein, partial [Opitutales bacterium]
DFHPLRDGLTFDRHLDQHGVADITDDGWRVRTLAVRDAVRLGEKGVPLLIESLSGENEHVRQVAAMALGILRAAPAVASLAERLRTDSDETVRSQAAVALGQIGEDAALEVLRERAEKDGSRDVRHQCEISLYEIENGISPGEDLPAAYASLDENDFRQVNEGQPALDFELEDTNGRKWRLSDFRGEKTVVLIWIFADWCPVCHREFQDLIRLREEFEKEDIQVFTIECHDRFRSRVMAGDEMHPKYWFSKDESPQASYGDARWWPHLVDLACGVGATYGVDPMQFVVHAERINRPATVIVNKEGIVRLNYRGTYWGDRPSIEETLDMIRNDDFSFEHPERRKVE